MNKSRAEEKRKAIIDLTLKRLAKEADEDYTGMLSAGKISPLDYAEKSASASYAHKLVEIISYAEKSGNPKLTDLLMPFIKEYGLVGSVLTKRPLTAKGAAEKMEYFRLFKVPFFDPSDNKKISLCFPSNVQRIIDTLYINTLSCIATKDDAAGATPNAARPTPSDTNSEHTN